ncbi:unnamed protein product [Ambrosiozyma monospora]|uniref:Unnamed protein product n=1 Tax=Ambrosiozyma monospora TaxID=43982 RepID=A0ACB5TEQ6_AMBMO|nr:unnamed protein product [Ambrosiozyma monospora]
MSYTTVAHFCIHVLPKLSKIKYVSIHLSGNLSNDIIHELTVEVPEVVIYFNYTIDAATRLPQLQRTPGVKITYESVRIFDNEDITYDDIQLLKQSRIEKLIL